MINATLHVINDISYFQKFYSKLCLLIESKTTSNRWEHFDSNSIFRDQEALWISSAQIRGHALKKQNSNRGMISCSAVSMLCSCISAVLGRNMQGLVRLEAESEGHFAFTTKSEEVLQSLAARNFHHYVELFGAMKTFAVGLELLAQKEPTELQLKIVNVNS